MDIPQRGASVSANDSLRQPEEDALWSAWKIQKDPVAREQLVNLHYEFARIMAGKLYSRRITDEVGFDEYLQLASLALVECVDRYDPSQGASFRTFAGYRMAGAILSGLESMSDRARQIALRRRVERERLESVRSGDPTGADAFERIAEVAVGLALGFMLDGVAVLRHDEGAYADNAYDRVLASQMGERIAARLSQLPEREAAVIRCHYFQQIPFEQIAQQMGVSKGRVSQIHRNGIALLRKTLGDADRLNIEM